MLFKGTKSFSANALARAINRTGGDINAYTDRKEMAFYCTVPCEHWKMAANILFELCFEPTFPPDEFEKERDVLKSEILSSLEDPEEQAFDYFLSLLRPNSPYSRPILGTFESLDAIEFNDLRRWWKDHMLSAPLTISCCGSLEKEDLLEWISSKSFPNHLTQKTLSLRPWTRPEAFACAVRTGLQTSHLVGGFFFPPVQALWELLSIQCFSVLWGDSLSSRLFQNIREKLGLCYDIGSQILEEEQGLVLSFFASCDPNRVYELIQALQAEVFSLTKEIPCKQEWEEAQGAFQGSLILAGERMENRMNRLFQLSSNLRRPITLEETLAGIQNLNLTESWEFIKTHIRSSSLLLWGRWKKERFQRLSDLWS